MRNVYVNKNLRHNVLKSLVYPRFHRLKASLSNHVVPGQPSGKRHVPKLSAVTRVDLDRYTLPVKI